MENQLLQDKYTALLDNLRTMGKVVLAFSGGVDSVLLLHAAHEALGDSVLAVTFVTPYSPKSEIEEGAGLAKSIGVSHRMIETPIFDIIRNNPPERCYFCKKSLFENLLKIAEEEGIQRIIDGSNVDDLDDYRPGFRAIKELGVQSPLLDAGMTKQDIRDLSKEFKLPTWDKPAGACLLTRLPHGTVIDEDELERIDKGEDYLKSLGFSGVRLRSHGDLARIELPEKFIASCVTSEFRTQIERQLKKLGYRYVTVDLTGYKMGSLNEIPDGPKE